MLYTLLGKDFIMEQKICDLKEQLATAIEYEALTSEKVVNISCMLDELIVEYIRKFRSKKACKYDELNIDKSQP
jgi:hypothetical protein